MAGPVLEMRNITKTFPGVKALSGVTLTVQQGEVHAICGENGAGKSTLMKVLSGVYPYGTYEGQIIYEGDEVRFSTTRQSESAGIAIIHQELALIPELSITENLFLGNEITRFGAIDWVASQKRARELLDLVGLREDPDTLIKTLGVGKQQLVEIAKALHKDVKLLILDEPTAALNETESQHLLDLTLLKRCEKGETAGADPERPTVSHFERQCPDRIGADFARHAHRGGTFADGGEDGIAGLVCEPHQSGRDEGRHAVHLCAASDRDGQRPETIAAIGDILLHEADIDECAEQAVCRRLAVAGLSGNIAEGEPVRAVAG